MTVQFEMDNASSPDSGRILSLETLLLHLGISDTATATETEIARSCLTRAEGAVIRVLRYDPVMSVRTEYYPSQAIYSPKEARWEANDTEAFLRTADAAASDELQVTGLPVREADSSGDNPIDLRIDYDGRAGTRSGSFGSSTIKVEGSDFYPNYDFHDSNGSRVCRDGIIRSMGLWPQAPKSVKIVYVAGYTAGELAGTDTVLDASPIQEAVLEEATRRFHQAMSKMKQSQGFTGPFLTEKLGDYSYSIGEDLQRELLSPNSDVLASTYYKLETFINVGASIFS